MLKNPSPQTKRTRLHRGPNRARYEPDFIYSVIDEALICHVAATLPDGSPIVLPTAHWRVGDRIYLHGHGKNGLLCRAAESERLCISVTVLDGLVLARSAFHHSMNYRSVVIHGRPEPVRDPAEKAAVLQAFMEKITPERSDGVRPANARELKATLVLSVPLTEVSGKTRMGPPVDDAQDMTLPVWAGVVPIRQIAGDPIEDPS